MKIGHIIAIGVHLLIAIVVISGLHERYQKREQEVSHIRDLAAEERGDTLRQREGVLVLERLIEGLRDRDPYVVELLARQRLGFEGSNQQEIAPPKLQ